MAIIGRDFHSLNKDQFRRGMVSKVLPLGNGVVICN